MSDPDRADDPDREHLRDVDDGWGCAEVWEAMVEAREAERGDGDTEE